MEALFFLVLSAIAALSGAAKLPNNFKRCPRSESKTYDTCLAKAVQDGIKKMEHGLPSLGLPPLEPLEIEAFSISKGNGPVSMYMHFRKVKIYGITNITIIRQTSTFTEKTIGFETHSLNDRLVFQGEYEVDGKVLVLPIKGKGKAVFILEGVEGLSLLSGGPVTKNGKKYYKLNKFDFTFNPKGLKIQLDNLFDGNKNLGLATNRILNDNWDEVLKEVKPAFEEALSTVFRDFSERVYKKVPIEDIYPNKV